MTFPGRKRCWKRSQPAWKDLPVEYQKILLLSDLAILYCRIDTGTAAECLQDGIRRA